MHLQEFWDARPPARTWPVGGHRKNFQMRDRAQEIDQWSSSRGGHRICENFQMRDRSQEIDQWSRSRGGHIICENFQMRDRSQEIDQWSSTCERLSVVWQTSRYTGTITKYICNKYTRFKLFTPCFLLWWKYLRSILHASLSFIGEGIQYTTWCLWGWVVTKEKYLHTLMSITR